MATITTARRCFDTPEPSSRFTESVAWGEQDVQKEFLGPVLTDPTASKLEFLDDCTAYGKPSEPWAFEQILIKMFPFILEK